MTIKCVLLTLARLHKTDSFPQERLTAKEAQAHPYFNPVRDPEVFKQNLATNSISATSKA